MNETGSDEPGLWDGHLTVNLAEYAQRTKCIEDYVLLALRWLHEHGSYTIKTKSPISKSRHVCVEVHLIGWEPREIRKKPYDLSKYRPRP